MGTLELPSLIGRYRIEGLLGQGAMGQVHRGYDEALARPVAVKTIHDHLLAQDENGELRRRFQQEGRAAARCAHPGIVTIYEVDVDAGRPFIAMEYVAGTSLKTCLAEQGRLGLEPAAGILLQVLDALAHAHARGVIHRDLKPANILLLPAGGTKLTDFGIARIGSAGTTRAGAVFGTPAYMAPEQRLGRAATPATDLYAVALIMLELLSGRRSPPTAGTDALATVRGAMPEDLPLALLQVLKQALAETPQARFQSAEAMTDALRLAVPGLTDTFPLPNGCAQDAPNKLGIEGPSNWHGRDVALDLPAPLEDELRAMLGPIAPFLARNYGRRTLDWGEFCSALALHIDEGPERKRFLRRCRDWQRDETDRHTTPSLSGTDPATSSGGTAVRAEPAAGLHLDAATERLLSQQLAEHVGPIARVLIRKALTTVASQAELIAVLAREIPDDQARRHFLRALDNDAR
jgi:serine/threonine-protein kinase